MLLRGTPITVQALVAESLYVALGSADSTIGAASTGVDLLSVGGVVNGLTQVIVAGKKYKTYSDLRGTTIGVQALASGATNVLKRILKKNGLDYPSDYKLLAVGGGSFNLAALTSGQIAATYLVVPLNYSAEEQGFNVLGYYKDYFPSYQLSVLAVKRGWAEKNRGLLVRFLKGTVRAHRWLYANKEAAIDFLAKEIPAEAGPRAQGLGILYGEPDLASQRRDKPRRTQVHDGDLCRTNEGSAAGSAEIHRHELPAAGDQRTRRKIIGSATIHVMADRAQERRKKCLVPDAMYFSYYS